MDKQNIALIVISSTIGGAESVVRQMAIHLDRTKFNCFIIVNEEIKYYFEQLKHPLISLGRFYKIFNISLIDRIFNRVDRHISLRKILLDRKVKKLQKIIYNNQIKLIHSHLLFDHYLVSKLVKKTGIIRIMTIHGAYRLDTTKRYGSLNNDEILAVHRKADYTTSACSYFISLLEKNGVALGNRYEIIPNGIDIQTIDSIKCQFTSNFDGTLRLVFLGGPKAVKGSDLLIKALNTVVNKMGLKNVKLTILRNIPKNSFLYKYVVKHNLQEYVDFVGYVYDNKHLEYISKSDLFVLPSRSEGIANTLMEAIGMCKPVLATNVGGTSEIVTHGKNGYLCQPESECIANGIAYFVHNPEKIKEFGEANKNLKEKFIWFNIINKYESLYKRLLAE